MDWNPPGSSAHGILQARILESVAIPFSRGSSWPRIFRILYCLSYWRIPLHCGKPLKWSEVAQSCLTLCDPMDCSLPGSIHEIFQARILEWVAISFSRGSSWPRDRTWVSRIAGRHFTVWATREARHLNFISSYILKLYSKTFALWLLATIPHIFISTISSLSVLPKWLKPFNMKCTVSSSSSQSFFSLSSTLGGEK